MKNLEKTLYKNPVVSPIGRKYIVAVEQTSADTYIVELYECPKRWFNKLFPIKVSWAIYEHKKWGRDFVAMASEEVKKYERYLHKRFLAEHEEEMSIQVWEKWDGRVQ